MPTYTFSPERFDGAYSTVPISELFRALISFYLKSETWKTRREGKPDRAYDKRVLEARKLAEEVLLSELKAGRMVAHASPDKGGDLRRIVPDYWNEDDAGTSLQGSLFAVSEGHHFTSELVGSAIVVRGDIATAMLARHGLNDTSPFYPIALYSIAPKNSARTRRSSKYDWDAFQEEVLRLMEYEGHFAGGWILARLEDKMKNWCSLNWDNEPCPRMIRDKANAAVRKFSSSRRAI